MDKYFEYFLFNSTLANKFSNQYKQSKQYKLSDVNKIKQLRIQCKSNVNKRNDLKR